MFEDNLETPEVIRKTSLADNLTYVSCGGKATDHVKNISQLWNEATRVCEKALEKDGRASDLRVWTNRFGASHYGGKQLSGAEHFYKACDAILFGKRTGTVTLQEGRCSRELTCLELQKELDTKGDVKGKISGAQVVFLDESDGSTGISLEVDGGRMSVYTSLGGDSKALVFELEAKFQKDKDRKGADGEVIKGEVREDRTMMTLCVDTPTTSRVTLEADSVHTLYEIQDGLLLGDVYPHPGAVLSFIKEIKGPSESTIDEAKLEEMLA